MEAAINLVMEIAKFAAIAAKIVFFPEPVAIASFTSVYEYNSPKATIHFHAIFTIGCSPMAIGLNMLNRSIFLIQEKDGLWIVLI